MNNKILKNRYLSQLNVNKLSKQEEQTESWIWRAF